MFIRHWPHTVCGAGKRKRLSSANSQSGRDGVVTVLGHNVTLLDVCTILVLKYFGSEDKSKCSTHVNNAPFLYLFCLANAISFTDGELIKLVFLHLINGVQTNFVVKVCLFYSIDDVLSMYKR